MESLLALFDFHIGGKFIRRFNLNFREENQERGSVRCNVEMRQFIPSLVRPDGGQFVNKRTEIMQPVKSSCKLQTSFSGFQSLFKGFLKLTDYFRNPVFNSVPGVDFCEFFGVVDVELLHDVFPFLPLPGFLFFLLFAFCRSF